MVKKEKILLKYNDVLDKIEKQDSHLLLWNGFNHWLGVDTSYWSIFKKMIWNDRWIYKDALHLVKESNYDLELFIGKLAENINDDNSFLKKYVANKVKVDFMKAAHEIVKDEIKNIYAEKNEGIYILLKHFTNYFTLNYDSFLYLLLLNFKSSENNKENTIAIQSSLTFQKEDINTVWNNIYYEIQEARKSWTLIIGITWENTTTSYLSKATKWTFTTAVKEYFKNKNWKWTDVAIVINKIWEEEKEKCVIENINDWFKIQYLFQWSKEKEFIFDINNETQNLFFLHWAFHIYNEEGQYKKITQKSDNALYDRLEEILNSEDRDITCIFQSENKIDEINKSEYLQKSYNKLLKLSWVMIIIWSSLSDNDKHIFNQINSSWINTLYISTREKSFDKNYEKAKKVFPNKNIYFFDTESISYELPTED